MENALNSFDFLFSEIQPIYITEALIFKFTYFQYLLFLFNFLTQPLLYLTKADLRCHVQSLVWSQRGRCFEYKKAHTQIPWGDEAILGPPSWVWILLIFILNTPYFNR